MNVACIHYDTSFVKFYLVLLKPLEKLFNIFGMGFGQNDKSTKVIRQYYRIKDTIIHAYLFIYLSSYFYS